MYGGQRFRWGKRGDRGGRMRGGDGCEGLGGRWFYKTRIRLGRVDGVFWSRVQVERIKLHWLKSWRLFRWGNRRDRGRLIRWGNRCDGLHGRWFYQTHIRLRRLDGFFWSRVQVQRINLQWLKSWRLIRRGNRRARGPVS